MEANDTKASLAKTLISLTHKKSFDKITIADITQNSGYNRQTFYYHFRDKQELLQWIYQQEVQQVFDDGLSFENWSQYMAILLLHMKQNQDFYCNSIRYEEAIFKDHLIMMTEAIFYKAIDALDIHQEIREQDKRFYSAFFSFGVVGVIISWVKQNMLEAPEKVASNLKSLAQDSERLAYRKYQEAYQKEN